MLVVCNGAFKSGSTWLYQIVSELVQPAPLDPRYQEPSWLPVPSIRPRMLRDFLTNASFADRNVVVKQHLHRKRQRDLLLTNRDVRVVNIKRDIGDVLLSAYHHFEALGETYRDFLDFYWRHGRYIADYERRYHALWSVPEVLTLTYEDLVYGFEGEVEKIRTFLAIALSLADIEELRERTSIGRLRERYRDTGMSSMSSEEFFRKGVPGEGAACFDEAMSHDLEMVTTIGISTFERARWSIRRRLSRATK